MDEKELQTIINKCQRSLTYHAPVQKFVKNILSDLANFVDAEAISDVYGSGALIEDFEQEIAVLLGKQAAVFMPSGTMAQQIAMRIWSDRAGIRTLAFHPTCHLEIHEQKGYEFLHQLRAVLVGQPNCLITLADLDQLHGPLSVLLLELPQREIGGQLPDWQDLLAQVNWARSRGIKVHLDGARLWECEPFYQREYAEIAGLFDSVYVSFYKGLGGITGSVLTGESEFIAEAKVWQRRHGGNLRSLFPYVLSAKKGLQEYLDQMDAFYHKAVEIAGIMSAYEIFEVVPNPPQTNMFHLYARAEKDALLQAAGLIAREKSIVMPYRFFPAPTPAYLKTEITIGSAALEISKDELHEVIALWVEAIKNV